MFDLDPFQYILYINKIIYASISEPDVLVPPVTQAVWKWKPENTEFVRVLSYIMRLCFKERMENLVNETTLFTH